MSVEKWEYLTGFVSAGINNPGAKEYIEQTGGNWKNVAKFDPITLIPSLNRLGEQGWELVHMEPVAIGRNWDVAFYGGETGTWSNVYFYVLKRRKVA